jgi:hypothetical protein
VGPLDGDQEPFDPDRFLDREDARRRFAALLQHDGTRRVLAIRAAGGAGKSDLLRWFEWSCDVPENGDAPLPVSRVPLDQVDGGRLVDLVHQIRTDLDTLDWGAFEAVRKRWLDFDTNLLDESYGQALIDNRGATIRDSPRFIGQNFENVNNVYLMGERRWPSKYHEEEVDKIYVRAFCADLRRNADRSPVVLLFDAYDRAPEKLRAWVEWFVHSHCLDRDLRAERLAVVLAGRMVPPFKARLQHRFDELVDMIDAFEHWTDELVARFLEQKGFPDARAGEIAMWRERINDGYPLQNVQPAMLAVRRKLNEGARLP